MTRICSGIGLRTTGATVTGIVWLAPPLSRRDGGAESLADPATQAAQLLDRGFERIYHQRAVPRPAIPKGA